MSNYHNLEGKLLYNGIFQVLSHQLAARCRLMAFADFTEICFCRPVPPLLTLQRNCPKMRVQRSLAVKRMKRARTEYAGALFLFDGMEVGAGMKGGRRKLLCLPLLLMAFFLTGCSVLGGDVENLLSPPHAGGSQAQVQKALEDSFGSAVSAKNYTLKYPKFGEYRSAFIFKDLDNDGEDEAIALYQPGESGSQTHINLLRLVDGNWVSVSDIVGEGTDIDQVRFGDFNGDGQQELLISWTLYSTRYQQITMYAAEADVLTSRSVGTYTDVYVGDITSSGRDSLLLITIVAAENKTTAELKTLQESSLAVIGAVQLDGYVQKIVRFSMGKLTDTVSGIYIDCLKDTGALITELIYWDGERLNAPFYNAKVNITTQTARRQMIPSMDIDSDGAVEWPTCELLPGYTEETEPDAMWMTYWNSFIYDTHQTQVDLAGIVNLIDGYCLRIEENWDGRVTAAYDADEHELQLQDAQEKEPFLIVRAAAAANAVSAEAGPLDGREFQLVGSSGTIQYSAWFRTDGEFALSLDRVRYMLLPLTDLASGN